MKKTVLDGLFSKKITILAFNNVLADFNKKKKMSTITSWQNHANELYNPFEEINKLRLEQSILSPNIFQVTNLSKQEVYMRIYLETFFILFSI